MSIESTKQIETAIRDLVHSIHSACFGAYGLADQGGWIEGNEYQVEIQALTKAIVAAIDERSNKHKE